MNAKTEARYLAMSSDRGLGLKATDGEPINVRINTNGTVSLTSRLRSDNGVFGSFEVKGLEPMKAASKKKGFWRKLWDAVKGAAAAVVDAVTVPLFGYRCRPDIEVDLTDGKFIFGIKCTEA